MEKIRTISHDFSKSPRPNRPAYKSGRFKQSRRNFRQKAGEKIDVRLFTKKPNAVAPEAVKIANKFTDFQINEKLKSNLRNLNYVMPTPIQDQAIPYILGGRDLIGLANTGTGKTGAFLIPLLNKAKSSANQRFLIIAPTRELAVQIELELIKFAAGMFVNSVVCVGGMPIYKQISQIRKNPQFVIGTPGRLKDLAKRRAIKFSAFNNIVLDEVDRMLDMGFVDEIKMILGELPKERQSLFFSATLPPRIRELIHEFTKDPVTVEVSSGKTAESIEQEVVNVSQKGMKFFQLLELLATPELSKVLIFSETKREVENLAVNLVKEGFKADAIHGDKRQAQRQKSLDAFKASRVKILVATDVAARGLDIKDITHVINYTVPKTYDDYIHRIGRTGRGTSTGKALTFVENYRF